MGTVDFSTAKTLTEIAEIAEKTTKSNNLFNISVYLIQIMKYFYKATISKEPIGKK